MHFGHAAATALACTAVVSAAVSSCGSDDSAGSSSAEVMAVQTGRPFPPERCASNRAVGTITYRSGFDFAAAASIVDVLVAKQKGYFDDLCLDVVVTASFSATNYSLIADNSAQFASAGSFSEVATYRLENPDADLVVLAVEGKSANDALVVKPGRAATVEDLRGSVIGVKGRITPSVQAMLAAAGLIEGRDYTTVPIEGYDPLAHTALADIDAFPVFKSNEPGVLDRAGVAYTLFDPAAAAIPGSFGILYSNRSFLDAHPLAAEDFMRATMRGLADAVADPNSASMIALDFIANSDNGGGLTPDGETFRWQTESKLVLDSTPADQPVGLPDAAALNAEVKAYAAIGLFGGTAPDIAKAFDPRVLRAIYDTTDKVIWPTK